MVQLQLNIRTCMNEKRCQVSIGNQGIFAILMENYPLHNLGYTKPIVTTQGNYSHGPKVG
jgi:hypothetical protein